MSHERSKNALHFLKIHLCLLITYSIHCDCFEFDQNYFGVSFRPYVKQAENGSFDFESYTYENVKTMLTVLSGKFGKVLVRDYYTLEDEYIRNFTYFEESYVSVYSGEIAANINREKEKKVLTVLYEIHVSESSDATNADIQLAFEAAEKANKIFPGTVEGLIFGKNLDISSMRQTLRHLNSYKMRASKLQLRLGVDLQSCFALLRNDNNNLVTLQKNVIVKASIISCNIIRPNNAERGPLSSFESVTKDMLGFQKTITSINPNVTVIGNLEWSSSGLKEWENINNLKLYWETASEWATQEKYTIYLEEAFDNPYRVDVPSDAHLGWWKLKSNSLINSARGYVEKYSEDEWDQFNAEKEDKRSNNSAISAFSQRLLFVLISVIIFL